MALPSLKKLAASENPFEDEDRLVQRLRGEKNETVHLEWKLTAPLGPGSTKRTKYRVVKAILSFANWEGGFVLLGVDNGGTWRGVDEEHLAHVDPAKLTELVNGCVFPDLPHLGYHEFRWRGKLFAVIHSPPSTRVPHVTTKDVFDRDAGGRPERLIQRYSLYCRRGGQSDLATPSQHHRLVARKTDQVRDELVRRIREVPVPILSGLVPSTPAPGESAVLVVRRAADDTSAPAVRLTRRDQGTAGVLIHEELADGLFDEINNVVDANGLLASDDQDFVLGEPVYYRIYAERQHVTADSGHPQLLARTGTARFYAPHLFWLVHLDDAEVAGLLGDLLARRVYPKVLATLRLVTLLGRAASDHAFSVLHAAHGGHPQPPQQYYTFRDMRKRSWDEDVRLLALRAKAHHKIELPWLPEPLVIGDLLQDSARASALLSDACHRHFRGERFPTTPMRSLDVLAYGAAIAERGDSIADLLGDGEA